MEQLKLLKSFLPKGDFWTIGAKFEAFLECLALELGYLKTYIANIKRESLCSTAEDTIAEWLLVYNVADTGNVERNKEIIRLYSSATGGQSVDYFNRIIQAVYPNVFIEVRDSTIILTLNGTLETSSEYYVLISFCKRIFPAYCIFYDFIEVEEEAYAKSNECGIAECGAAECGYDKEFNENEEYGISGVGVCNALECGNYEKTDSQDDFGECGIGECGIAECGYW